MNSFRKFFPLLALLALLPLTACSLAADVTPPPNYQSPTAPQAANIGPTYPLVSPDPSLGAPIYAEKCAPCHGDSGLGDGPQAANLPNPPTAIGSPDVARQSVPADWYTIITQGDLARFMPGFSGSLSDKDRWDVLAYVYSLSASPDVLAQGQSLYQASCAGCHGPQGKGDGPQAASLAPAPLDLTGQEAMSQLSQQNLYDTIANGKGSSMPAFASNLSQDQTWAVTAYLRALTFASGPQKQLAAATTGSPTSGTLTPPANTPESSAAAPTPASSGTPVVSQISVSGKITNGSGGSVPSGLTVTLQGFDNMQPTYKVTAPLQADDTYSFSNVEMLTGRVFLASVEVNGTTFSSDVANPQSGSDTLTMPVTIYDTSTDTSVLSADRMHVFLDFSKPDTMQVVELYIISNPTNKVVVAPQAGQAVLTFDLPAGASNLQFQDSTIGQRYVQTPNGFGDTLGVQPGSAQHQVLFAYDLPYPNKLSVDIPVSLPVKAAVVMLPDAGVSMQSSQLQDSGQQTVQGMNFHVFTSGELNLGSTLKLALSGKADQSASGAASSPGSALNILIGGIVLVLALTGSSLWLYFKQRKLKPAPQASDAPPEAAAPDADSLMDAIAALDDLYRAGKLPQEAYMQRRSELKAQLKQAMKLE